MLPLLRPSSSHKYPLSCACTTTQEVNHLWVNKVSRRMAFQLSLTFITVWMLREGLLGNSLPSEHELSAFSYEEKRIQREVKDPPPLILIALQCFTGVSKMSAFLLSHYCRAISASSSRRSELLPGSPYIQNLQRKKKDSLQSKFLW